MAQTKPYNYYIGPWVWHEADKENPMSFWHSPEGTVGVVDLRTSEQCGKAGGTPEGFGFFAVDGTLPAPYKKVSSGYLATTPLSNKSELSTASGYSTKGTTALDFLWEMLTEGADPKGKIAAKPLMPNVKGDLELYLGGHSLVKKEKFVYGVHPHTQKVKEVLQNDYRKLKAEFDAKGSKHYLKVLDFWKDKYGVADPENHFIPDDLLKEKPIKHNTIVGDTFVDDDTTVLTDHTATGPNGGFSWTFYVASNSWRIYSNELRLVYGSYVIPARAETDLSSSDMYSQVDIIYSGTGANFVLLGASARFSSSADTFYGTDILRSDSKMYLRKRVAGTFTEIATAQSITISIPEECKITTNGSTITGFQADVSRISATDTSITGNVRAGFYGFTFSTVYLPTLDNFEAGDLGGGGSSTPSSTPLILSVPTPTIQIFSDASPSATAVEGSLAVLTPAVQVSEDASPNATVEALTLATPTPTAQSEAQASQTAVVLALSVPTPVCEIVEDETASPAVESLTLTVPTPAVTATADATATPAAVALTFTLPTPALFSGLAVYQTALPLAVGLGALTLESGVAIDVSAEALALTQGAQTEQVTVQFNAVAATLALALPAATVTTVLQFLASTLSLAAALGTATIQIDESITVSAVALNGTVVVVVAENDVVLSMTALPLTGALLDPAVSTITLDLTATIKSKIAKTISLASATDQAVGIKSKVDKTISAGSKII